MERRCDRCGKTGQGPFERFHVGGRVWVGWDCMSVEEQRRERMVCERCEAPYYAQDDPDEGSRRAPATGAAGPPRTRLDGPGGDRRDRRAGLRDPQHSRKKSTCERRGGSFSFALSNVCTYPAGSPYARGCSRGGCLAHASFSRPLDARSSATNDGVTRWARSQRHRPLLLPGRAGARGASVERSVFLIVGSVAETAGTRCATRGRTL